MANLRDLAAFCDALPRRVQIATNERKRELVLAIVGNLVEETPIDKGDAISNWQVTLEAPSTTPIEPYAPSQFGIHSHATRGEIHGGPENAAGALDAARIVTAESVPGETIFIANPLDYIGFLNEDGRSNQAAPGFVERSILFGKGVADRAKLVV